MSMLAEELAHYDSDVRRIVKTARNLVRSDAPLAGVISRRQIASGKRLRAVVALLCGRLCGLPDELNDRIAIAIEIIHAATLLHDDVVDDASLRRRKSTANRIYGNAAAVLVGDFLYSRASQILSDINCMPLLAWISRATNSLAEGEVLQLEHRGKMMSEKTYFNVIGRKTANLFESAAAAAALVDDNKKYLPALAGYGRHLGVAFQLIDDCLDYAGSATETGKKIGADFSEGKMTLPAIIALSRADDKSRRRLLNGWKKNNTASFAETLQLVQDTGALDEVQRLAGVHAQRAAESLAVCTPGAARQTLETLAAASVNRRS